jgi:hypothetical protein
MKWKKEMTRVRQDDEEKGRSNPNEPITPHEPLQMNKKG